MFEKLRRAKSFINRTKHEDEAKQSELDLSETSHLRRNISINGNVLEQQRKLNQSREKLNNLKSRNLQKQVSRSQEHLDDQVLEQIRRINFGDSHSKKDAKKLSHFEQSSGDFQRHHPAYISERNVHRRSSGAEDGVQKHGKTDKHVHHRTSGDVASNFDRNNRAYCSERHYQSSAQKESDSSLLLSSNDDFLLNRKSVDMSYNFDKRNPAYVSDKGVSRKKSDVLDKSGLRNLFQKIRGNHKSGEKEASDVSSFSECSTGSSSSSFNYVDMRHQDKQSVEKSGTNSGSCSNTSTASSSASVGLDGKVNKKLVSEHTSNIDNFTRNSPIYSSERNIPQRRKVVASNIDAKGKVVRTIFDHGHPSYYSKENYAQTQNNDMVNKKVSVQPEFQRNRPAYSSERNFSHKQSGVPLREELSRKRAHCQTKPNVDRNKPAYALEKTFQGESRKVAFDRIKQDNSDVNR